MSTVQFQPYLSNTATSRLLSPVRFGLQDIRITKANDSREIQARVTKAQQRLQTQTRGLIRILSQMNSLDRELQRQGVQVPPIYMVPIRQYLDDQIEAFRTLFERSLRTQDTIIQEALPAIGDQTAELTYRSYTDFVTQSGNREFFFEQLDREVEHARNNRAPLAVAIFDLDRFKEINDNFGHPTGDQALRLFSETLNRISTDKNHVARLGGDEFAIIFPNPKSPQEVSNICKRFARALASPRSKLMEIPLVNQSGETRNIEMHVSIGIKYLNFSKNETYNNYTDAFQVYKAADDEAYIAKAMGKDHFTRTQMHASFIQGK